MEKVTIEKYKNYDRIILELQNDIHALKNSCITLKEQLDSRNSVIEELSKRIVSLNTEIKIIKEGGNI